MTYRARSNGVSIIEVPISFKDRLRGESKMSKAIVVEALGLVTTWGVERMVAKYRERRRLLNSTPKRGG